MMRLPSTTCGLRALILLMLLGAAGQGCKEDAANKGADAAKTADQKAKDEQKLTEDFVKEYQKKLIPVAAGTIDIQRVVKTFSSTTFLEPIRQVALEVPRKGVVANVFKLAGEEVKEGETIATLSSHELMSEYRKRSIQLANTRRPYLADQKLFKQQLISKDQWEKSRSSYRSAQVEFSRAKKNLDQLKIIAPFAGVVASNALQIHQPMDQAPKTPIEIVDTAQLKGAIHVPVFYRASVKVGHSLEVVARGVRAKATIERIAPVVDRSSGTVAMHFLVANPDQALFAGESVRVILPLDQGTDKLVLPENSVVFEGSAAFVYTVRASERKEIRKEFKAFLKRKKQGAAGQGKGKGKGKGRRRGKMGGSDAAKVADAGGGAKATKAQTESKGAGQKDASGNQPKLTDTQIDQMIKVDRAKKVPVQVEQIPSGRYAIAGKNPAVKAGEHVVIIGLTQMDDGRKIEIVQ